MEVTVTSVQSVTHANSDITEQPNRFARWWIRHYRHIGLASMAGSAILVCITAVILLPLIVRHLTKEEELCSSIVIAATESSSESTPSSTWITTTIDGYILPTTSQTVPMDPLCAADAIWKNEGVTVAGSSTGASSRSRSNLANPRDVLIDRNGGLLIADCANNRVIHWSVNATEGHVVAGINAAGSWINAFKCATSIVVWKDQLYVSDLGNYRILAFPLSRAEGSPDGMTIIGRYGAGSTLNQITRVYHMTIDRIRQLFYLSDYDNFRILKLNLTDYSLQLIAGTGTMGADNMALNLPLGITVDEITGAFYVADAGNHRIQKFSLNSAQGMTVAGGNGPGQTLSQLNSPSNVAIDSTGNLYIADRQNHRIIQWLVGAQQGRIIAGTGIAGLTDAQLNTPVQLQFDSHYNLYVVDQANNRVQRFDLLYNGC